MNNRFYTGFNIRNFARSRRNNPYQSVSRRRTRIISRRRGNPPNRPMNNRRNNTNSPRMHETLMNFKVYAGAIKAEGLIIDLGPNTKLYNGTSFVTTALNYNGYRPVSATLEYTPLLNQTQAVSTINAFLSTDIKTAIPSTDADMKNSTVSHKGIEWFAARRTVQKFVIPPLKHGVYETGSGAKGSGSPYEEAARIIVKPTAVPADTPLMAFGETYLNITVAFSAPATPILPDQQTIEVGQGFAVDVIYKFADFDKNFLQILFEAGFAKYLCVDYITNVRAVNTWYTVPKESADEAFDLLDFKNQFMFSNTLFKGDIYKIYNLEKDAWEDVAANAISSVQVVKPIATAHDVAFYNRDLEEVVIHSTPVPVLVNNKIVPTLTNTVIDYSKLDAPEEERVTVLNSQPMPSYLTQPVVNANNVIIPNLTKFIDSITDEELTIESSPIPTYNKRVDDSDTTFVEIQNQPVDVTVTNQSLDVKVVNDVNTKILDQPIDVHQVKSAGDVILDLLGSLIGKLRIEGKSEPEITLDSISEIVGYPLPMISPETFETLKTSHFSN